MNVISLDLKWPKKDQINIEEHSIIMYAGKYLPQYYHRGVIINMNDWLTTLYLLQKIMPCYKLKPKLIKYMNPIWNNLTPNYNHSTHTVNNLNFNSNLTKGKIYDIVGDHAIKEKW